MQLNGHRFLDGKKQVVYLQTVAVFDRRPALATHKMKFVSLSGT